MVSLYMLRSTLQVMKFDAMTELRRKYALGGILLYVVAAVYVSYLSFMQELDPRSWNALFWIIILFAAINGTAKSFISESRGRMLYYFFLARPSAFITGRTLYNICMLTGMGALSFAAYALLNGDPIENHTLFLLSFFLGIIGLSVLFTLVSAIASKAGHNLTLMSILSFPVVLPLIVMLIRLTHFSISGLDLAVSSDYLISLLSLDLLMFVLSYVLFPYLWNE